MQLFDYNDYKKYLAEVLQKRGLRKQIAEQLRCNPSFISRILNGDAHFSLEQGDRINRLLSHEQLESKYFMALLNQAKAGTPSLRSFFQTEINDLRKMYQNLHYRLGEKKQQIPAEITNQYYSSWLYVAVDSLLTSGIFDNEEDISKRLKVDIKQVRTVIDHLLRWDIIRKTKQNTYEGATHVHLEAHSPEILKHHVNWRLHMLRSLDAHHDDSLHYSSVVTIAHHDIEKIRGLCLDFIQKLVAEVTPSPAEEGYVFCLDFSRL